MKTTSRPGAFTLVEMLVAIAVLSILLAVVFVPLRLAISSYHIGSSRNATQNAAQASLDQMERDFRRAAYVFPNTALVNVTYRDSSTGIAPYTNNFSGTTPNFSYSPYTRATDPSDNGDNAAGTPPYSPVKGVCNRTGTLPAIPWNNTSRVDMILAKRNASGNIILPVQLGDTVVTYYARRQQMGTPYSPVDNPVVLFRAEMPFRDAGVTVPAGASGTTPNVDITPARLGVTNDSTSCGTTSTLAASTTPRGSLWLAHNANGEANLEPLTQPGTTGSHTLAIPRGIGLVDSQAYKVDPSNPDYNLSTINYSKEAPLQPDTSFQLSDTNGNGKINQVAVSLALETFDANQGAAVGVNKQPTGQIVRARRVFDLPNVR